MDLDEIKARMDHIFATAGRGNTRAAAPGLRQALIEFKAGIELQQQDLTRAERELAALRQEMSDYQRRGQQAAGIGDLETVRIADDFTARTAARVDLLERKVILLRDEISLAQREYDLTLARYKAASHGLPLPDEILNTESSAGGLTDREAREAVVDAQLAQLKARLRQDD